MEQLFLRRPRVRVSTAHHQSSKSQALPSQGHHRTTAPAGAELANTSYLACPFARREVGAGEADYLAAVLCGDLGCELLLDLVPVLAVDGSVQAEDCSHARIFKFDDWRF